MANISNDSSASGSTTRTPGQPDMWILVLIEAVTFCSYFVVYTIHYKRNAEAFLAAQSHLSLLFGVIITILLLTSSWAMARCVQQSRVGNYSVALRDLAITAVCGVIFVGLKLYEWSLKIREGLYFSENEFFSYYYFLTGIHLLHVLVGFIVLGVIFYQIKSPKRRSQEIVETCATYWHMVDFLWVIIFALLYVMR